MKERHLVITVEDSMPKTNLFYTKKSMNSFINKFQTNYIGKERDGWWIDFVIIGITGDIIYGGELLE